MVLWQIFPFDNPFFFLLKKIDCIYNLILNNQTFMGRVTAVGLSIAQLPLPDQIFQVNHKVPIYSLICMSSFNSLRK